MGLLRSALLLGAARRLAISRPDVPPPNLLSVPPAAPCSCVSTAELALNPESQMGKFFDSPIGKPLQPYALRAVEFAARVREGMQEKEMELKREGGAPESRICVLAPWTPGIVR